MIQWLGWEFFSSELALLGLLMCLVSWQMGWQLNDLECLQRPAVERLLARVTGRLGQLPVAWPFHMARLQVRWERTSPITSVLHGLCLQHLCSVPWAKAGQWPRFKEWRNRPHLWMGEAAKSHCKEARTGWEESATVLYATAAMRLWCAWYRASHTFFHLPPRCSELPWHHDRQKNLRLNYKMCVGNDRGVGEEVCSREVVCLGHKDVLPLLIGD